MTEKKFLQEPDRVPARRLASIGLAGLLVFSVGAMWATSVQRGATGSVRGDTAPRPAVAGVVHVPIERAMEIVAQRGKL
jgi:hypothetical protein